MNKKTVVNRNIGKYIQFGVCAVQCMAMAKPAPSNSPLPLHL